MFAPGMSMNILTIVRPSIHSLLSNNLNILIIGARGPEVPEVAASDLSVPGDKDVRKKEVFWCSEQNGHNPGTFGHLHALARLL